MIKKLFHFIFVILLLAVIIGVPGGWMYYRSYNDPEVHYFYTKEGEGEQSLRFVVVSDLYGYVFEGGNGVIADLAGNTFPDAILIGGNMITEDTKEITPLTDLIKRLTQIAPVYYSYGEQELKYVKANSGRDGEADPLREALEKAGAVVLNEEYTDVSIYGVNTRIGGMYNNAYEMTNLRGQLKKRYEGTWNFLNEFQESDSLKIMLSSRPESFIYADACDRWNVDLVVSGSDLGGLVVIPYYGGLLGGSQGYFPEYIHGMYEKGDVNLFITSGLSAPAGYIPRLNNPPEIAVLDIDGLTMSGAQPADAGDQGEPEEAGALEETAAAEEASTAEEAAAVEEQEAAEEQGASEEQENAGEQ